MKIVFKIGLGFVLYANLAGGFAGDLLSLYKEAKMHDFLREEARHVHKKQQKSKTKKMRLLEISAEPH